MAKKQTAEQLAWETYKENEPIDWRKIGYIERNYNRKERLDWARDNVAYWANGASKNLITRAAKELLNLLGI